MIIKSGQLPRVAAWIDAGARFLSEWRRLRLIVAAFLVLSMLGGVSLTSLYVGIQIADTSRATGLKGWLVFVVGDKVEIAGNYLRSMWTSPEHLNIDIKYKHFVKLAKTRQKSVDLGYYSPRKNDWVPARIHHESEKYKVALRLKGQEGDHWRDPNQWSLKINVKEGKTLFGMKRFALQAPRTRNYMNEWVFHRLLAHIGLIHLRYQFVSTSINGQPDRIMAIEENFDKRLIENNRRREGPIFRLNAGRYRSGPRGLAATYLTTPVEPYQEKLLSRSTKMQAAFQRAVTQWEGFRLGRLPASDVFDIESISRLMALTDVLGGSHPLSLRNLKFYYNPIIGKIEPLAYDLTNIGPTVDRTLTGSGTHAGYATDAELQKSWLNRLFADKQILEAYIRALAEFSQPEFLEDFFAAIDDDFKAAMSVLAVEFPWYQFDRRIVYGNQAVIRRTLNQDRPVRAYARHMDAEKGELTMTLVNMHYLPYEVLGISFPNGHVQNLTTPRLLAGYDKKRGVEPVEITVNVPSDWRQSEDPTDMPEVNIRLIGLTRVLSERLKASWGYHDWTLVSPSRIAATGQPPERDFLAIDNAARTVTIRQGKWIVRRDLVIPAGYRVLAGPGTTLDLRNNAAIISYSPLNFEGDAEALVEIVSSDGSGQGLLVIRAGRPSRLSHVLVHNLTNPAVEGWVLTGAITFYESAVEIDQTHFVGSRSEDALNIVRSEFKISNSTFALAYSDAIDIDFSSGSIVASRIITSGNDAIDLSGSTVTLADVQIDRAGDKGISIGEKSDLRGSRVEISNSEIAVAVKDSSQADFVAMSIKATRVGFAIFQKKSEFDVASTVVRELSMAEVGRPHLVQSGSSLTINGAAVSEQLSTVEDLLYGAKYGKASVR